jgi:hypothetical protein
MRWREKGSAHGGEAKRKRKKSKNGMVALPLRFYLKDKTAEDFALPPHPLFLDEGHYA